MYVVFQLEVSLVRKNKTCEKSEERRKDIHAGIHNVKRKGKTRSESNELKRIKDTAIELNRVPFESGHTYNLFSTDAPKGADREESQLTDRQGRQGR